VTIAGARQMRTELRSSLTAGNMTPDNADRITAKIMGAVSEDVERSLKAAGRDGAVAAYRAADKAYAERQDIIRTVLQPIIGKRSEKTAEEVARALETQVKANGGRMARFLDTLHPEEANIVRASLINQLGRARSGQQDAAGEAFSLDTFLTHWDEIRASRSVIFGREATKGLQQLANVAGRAKMMGRARNHSNTVGALSSVITAAPGIAGGTALAMGSPGMAAAGMLVSAIGAAVPHVTARLLASPKFAQRLAETPANPQAAARYWSSPWVARMASRDPAIAGDLAGVQQAIIKAANDNAGMLQRSAASGGDDPNKDQNQR
jgi:acyl dehydratase